MSLAQFHANIDPASHFDLPLSMEAREELDDLTQTITTISLDHMETDEWILCWWDLEFKPRKYYKFLFRNVSAPTYITKIWKSKCIMRHKVFAWLMLLDRVNTRDMLLKRHFFIGEDHACLLCNISRLETNKHLFHECSFAKRCWDIIGMQWNYSVDTQQMFDQARLAWHKPLFKEITILAAWNIWKQRNKVLFDGARASHSDWLRMFRADLEILRFRVDSEKTTFLEGFSSFLVLWFSFSLAM